MRLDKWMWAVRLFKTRGLAARACESGRVKEGGRILKASSTLRGGELIELPFQEGPGTRVVRVTGLIDRRVGAPQAREACDDITPEDVIEARRLWSANRSHRKEGEQGRPTKKKRREIDRGFFE
ncbi:S4 domain-containing protein [Haloferula rosea]|uniref:RNA-binding S4 domain-containing protein n=1 Tax=Haloferula rosea TaxID=490093 RepID=A0A934R5K8_9BACT|nr:S4 domain-containing protein [Haloferula rosea]MBK1825719.1 RNA-binding S4 domain-containing protein [Haloferula rosea]